MSDERESVAVDNSPRPFWRWWLWCALNGLHISTNWRWVRRAWQWAILPAWLGDYEASNGKDEPF